MLIHLFELVDGSRHDASTSNILLLEAALLFNLPSKGKSIGLETHHFFSLSNFLPFPIVFLIFFRSPFLFEFMHFVQRIGGVGTSAKIVSEGFATSAPLWSIGILYFNLKQSRYPKSRQKVFGIPYSKRELQHIF